MLRTLEKYEIIEEIGHGGMATVYRARDTKLDRLVALKVMHPHLRASKEARARFRREAQGVAKLRHPRVLEIYDYSGEDSEESYIATELLTGPTLKKFADDHPNMPAEIAACFAIEVSRALAAAHEKGIVHRDVKPENILLHEATCVKLTDFGIADMVDSQTMTATGQILGSPGHMAPEQIEGKDCDQRTDVFSLGTVLYFLSCGKLPFTGRNPHQVLKRIVDGDYADPLRVQPAIGGKLRAIIVRSLSHDAANRQASAIEIEKDLRAFVREIGIEKPEQVLAEYLGDPERVSAEMTRKAIRACTDLGKKARDAGDVPGALDYFGRVLALDNGNAEVLSLVDSVGRARRRRSQLAYGVAAAAAIAIVAGGWAALSSATNGGEIGPLATADDAGIAAQDGGAVAASATDSGALAAAESDSGVTGIATTKILTPPFRRPDAGPRVPAGAPVHVAFDFNPVDVTIAIDHGTPQRYSTEYTGVDLVPGEHSFRISAECCEALEFTARVPSGVATFPLRRRLASRPAQFFVYTDADADVVVGGGIARGRTNSLISVPIEAEARHAVLSYQVTAEGYRAYTGAVDLVAGEDTIERPNLEAEPPP